MRPRLVYQQLPLFSEFDAGRLAVPAIGSLRRDWHSFADLHKLTARERQTAELLVFELTDVQLASQLGVSKQTINIHLGHLRTKLKTRSRLGIGLLVVGGAECECHAGWTLPAAIQVSDMANAS